MNVPPALFTFLLCFVYVTSSAPPEETVIQKLNRELLNSPTLYDNYLASTALPAASAGKNVFKMPESLSEDCIRTAKAVMYLLATPSAWDTTKSVMTKSSLKAFNETKSAKSSINPMELYCQQINKEFRNSGSDYSNFEVLKKKLDFPKPTKNYYIDIQPQQSIIQFLRAPASQFDDPSTIEFTALKNVQAYEYLGLSKKYAELAGIGKAIRHLSEQKMLSPIADSLFHTAFEEYIKDVVAKNSGNYEKMLEDAISESLMRKMDEHFRNHDLLKKEYEKIKKAAVDEINKTAKF